jgi:hypothetical protein
MRGGMPEEAQITVIDVAAWALLGVSTVLTIGYALMAIAAVAPAELPITAVGAIVLISSAGYAGVRHLRAVRRAADARNQLALCMGDEAAARDRLSFARHAAALMSSLPQDEGVRAILNESIGRFHAQAAAVVGDRTMIVTAPEVDGEEATKAVTRLAQETVKSGRSVTVVDGQSGVAALTAPIRIGDQMRDVLALWRRGH